MMRTRWASPALRARPSGATRLGGDQRAAHRAEHDARGAARHLGREPRPGQHRVGQPGDDQRDAGRGQAHEDRLGAERLAAEHEDALLAVLDPGERRELARLLGRVAAAEGLTPGIHPGYRDLPADRGQQGDAPCGT